ncbi:MAG TPA: hypothetical protein VHG93_18560 [Longimicrobium sp.]|nr:hypothetical protein [Longimicrobium sp.]
MRPHPCSPLVICILIALASSGRASAQALGDYTGTYRYHGGGTLAIERRAEDLPGAVAGPGGVFTGCAYNAEDTPPNAVMATVLLPALLAAGP